jgi:hypothetical protein
VVSMLASGTRVRGFEPGQSGRKIPQHAFLRKGSKAVCSVSQICDTLKNPVVTWKLGHRQNKCRPFLVRFPPSLIQDSPACVAWSASGVDGGN